jgi:hypothetical protein
MCPLTILLLLSLMPVARAADPKPFPGKTGR